MLIPVLGNLVVSYCPEHDEVCLGVLMEHRCESSVHIGFLNETYVEMLERENEKLKEGQFWLEIYEEFTGHSVEEVKELIEDYKRKYKGRLK